ncbi:MAG: ribosomal protein S18-alanine N-acetyltransferase [Burkholderiaceae bacterium]|nr:ribosomal protein S18-alanine N-acetyltransferase [Burkholderiaceae bacterium]
MQARDVDAVMAVERLAYDFPWTAGNFLDSLSAGYEAELALDARGDVAAYRIAMVGVDEMHLLNLTVRPDLQGQGLARQMLGRLEDDCRRLALSTLWLEVRPSNARARMLYQRWGFREVGLRRGYYPAAQGRREDAIVMRRTVPEAADGLD